MEAIANCSPGKWRGLAVGAAVEAALRQDRLFFAYQPVVCAATGRVDYFECLLRMRDEEGGIVSGGEFITIIEELGWIGLIDRYVLKKTVHDLAADPEVRLGLNISGMTAGDRPWLRLLISLLRHRRDIARRLVVEITETAALGDIAESVRFVDKLRDAGPRRTRRFWRRPYLVAASSDLAGRHRQDRRFLGSKSEEPAAKPDLSAPSARSHQRLRFDHGGRMRRKR